MTRPMAIHTMSVEPPPAGAEAPGTAVGARAGPVGAAGVGGAGCSGGGEAGEIPGEGSEDCHIPLAVAGLVLASMINTRTIDASIKGVKVSKTRKFIRNCVYTFDSMGNSP
jgi:hypothetical protein